MRNIRRGDFYGSLCQNVYMITLSKINGEPISINPDHFRFIECARDTVITFFDGKTIMVKESPKEINIKIINFRKSFSQNYELESVLDNTK